MRRLWLGSLMVVMASATLLMQACSRPLAPQESCNFVQNSEVQRVSWKSRLPVKLYLHESVPATAYATLERAVDEYNLRLGKEVLKIVGKGATGELNPRKDGYSVVYWFNSWDPQRPTEQARTTIYWSGNQVFEADIRVNAYNFSYNYGDSLSFSNVDLDSLMVHEFGHALGLAHAGHKASVMSATLDNGQVRRKLSDEDLANLRCEY